MVSVLPLARAMRALVATLRPEAKTLYGTECPTPCLEHDDDVELFNGRAYRGECLEVRSELLVELIR